MEVKLSSSLSRLGRSKFIPYSFDNERVRAKAKRWCLELFFPFCSSSQSVGYVLLLLVVRVNEYRTWHGGRVVSRNMGGNNKWNISGT